MNKWIKSFGIVLWDEFKAAAPGILCAAAIRQIMLMVPVDPEVPIKSPLVAFKQNIVYEKGGENNA